MPQLELDVSNLNLKTTSFFSSVNEFSKIYLIFFSDNGKVLTE